VTDHRKSSTKNAALREERRLNDLGKRLRRHHDRAAAEALWCMYRQKVLKQSGQDTSADVKLLYGEHWKRMWREWAAVARLCRKRAKIETRARHPVVAAILTVAADTLTLPGNPIKAVPDAIELFNWLPSTVMSTQDRRAEAQVDVASYPVLDSRGKAWVSEQIRTKPGRPPATRGLAAEALEQHMRGKSWSQIERRLLPARRNVKNPGEDIRREAQLLRALLRRHGVLFPD
jgi:hypothetical protein